MIKGCDLEYPLVLCKAPVDGHDIYKNKDNYGYDRYRRNSGYSYSNHILVKNDVFIKYPDLEPVTAIRDDNEFKNWLETEITKETFVARDYDLINKGKYWTIQIDSDFAIWKKDPVLEKSISKSDIDLVLSINNKLMIKEDNADIQAIIDEDRSQWYYGNRYNIHYHDGYIIEHINGKYWLSKDPARATSIIKRVNSIKNRKKHEKKISYIHVHDLAWDICVGPIRSIGGVHDYHYKLKTIEGCIRALVEGFKYYFILKDVIIKNLGVSNVRDTQEKIRKVKALFNFTSYGQSTIDNFKRKLKLNENKLKKLKANLDSKLELIDNANEEIKYTKEKIKLHMESRNNLRYIYKCMNKVLRWCPIRSKKQNKRK